MYLHRYIIKYIFHSGIFAFWLLESWWFDMQSCIWTVNSQSEVVDHETDGRWLTFGVLVKLGWTQFYKTYYYNLLNSVNPPTPLKVITFRTKYFLILYQMKCLIFLASFFFFLNYSSPQSLFKYNISFSNNHIFICIYNKKKLFPYTKPYCWIFFQKLNQVFLLSNVKRKTTEL